MIVVAESGSTKTDWRLIKDNGEVLEFVGRGLNPRTAKYNYLTDQLYNLQFNDIDLSEVHHLYFYGAGCVHPKPISRLVKAISLQFTKAKIYVESDLMAACIATSKNEKSMVAILGTGANTCIFDGEKITENLPALGYVLGDYGAGAFIGKLFITDVLNNELPKSMKTAFEVKYTYTSDEILDKIYQKPSANRFFASFLPFLKENENDVYVKQLLTTAFNLFFEKYICKYKNYKNLPLNVVGSVAHVFNDIFTSCAASHSVKIGRIVQKPIDELVTYYKPK